MDAYKQEFIEFMVRSGVLCFGEFTTKSSTPTDLENTNSQSPSTNPQKLLRDGQLYIYHNGSAYNVMGVIVE